MSFLIIKQFVNCIQSNTTTLIGSQLIKVCTTTLRNPNYNIGDNTAVTSIRGYKSLIKIKWKRPEPVAFNDPRKSGDGHIELGKLDLKKPILEFMKSENLSNQADENVKKVFSCDFNGRKHAVEIEKKDLVDRVKRHAFDNDSREVMIAKYTISIRSLQDHYKQHPQDKLNKVRLKEIIDKRNKYLKLLRMEDYAKFEWILENLNIKFRPGPSIRNNVHRKESLRRLVDKHIEDDHSAKLTKLRNQFNEKKIDFYKKKAETLEWIYEQETKYGKEPSVTKTEIEEMWKKYEELLDKTVEKYEPPKHYHQFA